jgi:hypothetical protein
VSTADFLVLFRWAYKQEKLDRLIKSLAAEVAEDVCVGRWAWWDFGEGTSDPVFSLADLDPGDSTTTYSTEMDISGGDSTTT